MASRPPVLHQNAKVLKPVGLPVLFKTGAARTVDKNTDKSVCHQSFN